MEWIMGWQMQVTESTEAFKIFCHWFSAALFSCTYIIHQQILVNTVMLLS